MKVKFLLPIALILILSLKVSAQQVPSRMEFANMDLRLTDGAIRDIQADVDALTRNEKYFQKKLQRVDMYMPIIERIFKEEDLPEDFKYLVIQESALVSDAVSSSNAVGFWQFKEISGLENNLRIDRSIDERMNIVSSSRAAANYLKSHNQYFDNWAYALIAYQRGRGGAADVIDESNFGKTRLKITKDSYWYLKKYLAHKIAFQHALGASKPPYYLKEVENIKGTSLRTISKQEGVPLELLEEYNKWIRRGKIPEDKNYTVIVPLSNLEKIEKLQDRKKAAIDDLPGSIDDDEQKSFPLVEHYPSKSDRSIPHKVEINGLDGIYAPVGFTVKKLAETAGLDEYKFRKYNDLKIRDALKTGRIYYLRRKRNRAKFYYHTVTSSESMWEISQKYGVKLDKLYRKNRMQAPDQPEAGRVLWLRQNRPSDIPVEFRKPPEALVEKEENTQQKIDTTAKQVNDNLPETESVKVDSLHSDSLELNMQKVAVDSTSTSTDSVEDNLSVSPALDSTKVNAEVVITEVDSAVIAEEETEQDEWLEDSPQYDANEFTKYEIKKGDTFFSIANRFNMKISTLLNVNELEIRDTLSIGQVIQVNKSGFVAQNIETANKTNKVEPDTETQETTDSTEANILEHTVKPGDTMYALAKKYAVSLKEIMEWNNKTDYNLKEDELIIIKQK